MTAYPADQVSTSGATANKRTGSLSSDTVPAGALLLISNSSATVAHNFDLGVNFAYDGLNPGSASTGPGKRRIVVPISGTVLVRVRSDAGDANGQCSVTIDTPATDLTYYVIGA